MPGLNREQQRLKTLNEMGLLEADSIPIFEEATQTAAHLLDVPICVLGLPDHEKHLFKSAFGLSRIGLMNSLAMTRQLPRSEAFGTHVLESQQPLAITDTTLQSAFSDYVIVQRYGIRSYLGVPLVLSNGSCIGTLEVMDLEPRKFTHRDISCLELVARWSMSEYERSYVQKQQLGHTQSAFPVASTDSLSSSTSTVKSNLLAQMTQELRTPLTSILGMASVLNREIYGPLTDKQKEYLNIVHTSGQYLLSLVNEILELGALDDSSASLNINSIDIEMLCQQALSTLELAARRRDQSIQLTIEPGSRIWLLDKDKVRQMLYHLVFSVIQSATAESIIRVHVSRKQTNLNIKVWTSHPWFGEETPLDELTSSPVLIGELASQNGATHGTASAPSRTPLSDSYISAMTTFGTTEGTVTEPTSSRTSRQGLGLMLSRRLAEMHDGSISIQGTSESGYSYVISLPQFAGAAAEG